MLNQFSDLHHLQTYLPSVKFEPFLQCHSSKLQQEKQILTNEQITHLYPLYCVARFTRNEIPGLFHHIVCVVQSSHAVCSNDITLRCMKLSSKKAHQ